MSKRVLVIIAVLSGICLTAGIAYAALVSFGPVNVVSADSFSSTGTEITGWYWLRDTPKAATAMWTFSGLPTTRGVTKGDVVFLRFDSLVTNKASGGSGYDAYVQVSYRPRTGAMKKSTVFLDNQHPEMKDVRDTGGWGYSADGCLKVPVTKIPSTGVLTVEMKRVTVTKYHVAANQGACTVEYLTR